MLEEVVQPLDLVLGEALHEIDERQRHLSLPQVGAEALSSLRLVPRVVETVVDDLEGHSEVQPKAVQALALLGVEATENSAQLARYCVEDCRFLADDFQIGLLAHVGAEPILKL